MSGGAVVQAETYTYTEELLFKDAMHSGIGGKTVKARVAAKNRLIGKSRAKIQC
jgi:hypothetical protein